jgi:light-harvesting complex I chlorophyll a/b binding protein 1
MIKRKILVTMKFVAALTLVVSGASAFAPSSNVVKSTSTSLNALNGWVPDSNAFAYGLPGSTSPIANFDPLGISKGASLLNVKRLREAETQHGRVAMLAVLGLLVTEQPIEFHPLFEAYNKDIGPAIRHLDEVRAVTPIFFEIFAIVIGYLELYRALTGWKIPDDDTKFQDLKDNYYPGDIGFDPLGLKPTVTADFLAMSTKEINNGRLAMLGVAGMVAQELVNGKEIFVNLGISPDKFDPSSLPIQF